MNSTLINGDAGRLLAPVLLLDHVRFTFTMQEVIDAYHEWRLARTIVNPKSVSFSPCDKKGGHKSPIASTN